MHETPPENQTSPEKVGQVPEGYEMPPADWRGYDIDEANRSLFPLFTIILFGLVLLGALVLSLVGSIVSIFP